jgi:hypothetical protein
MMGTPKTPSGPGTPLPGDRLPTYQELLDEAVNDTFPASDPIAPNAAAQAGEAVHTPRDGRDWRVQGEGEGAPALRLVATFPDNEAAHEAMAAVLAAGVPSVRLDTQPDSSVATLTIAVDDEAQALRATDEAKAAGAVSVSREPA